MRIKFTTKIHVDEASAKLYVEAADRLDSTGNNDETDLALVRSFWDSILTQKFFAGIQHEIATQVDAKVRRAK